MNWFKRRVCRWLGVDSYHDDGDEWGAIPSRENVKVRMNHDAPGFFDRNPSVNYRVYAATGGTIVEVNRWDTTRQEWTVNMHIISDDEENKTDAIAKIMTLEMIR